MTEGREGEVGKPLDVYHMIMVMVEQMSSVAWQKLGLQPDLVTGAIHKDIEQARVAIDVTAGLAGFLEPQLDEEDKRRIHSLIRDLKINYVQNTSGGSS